MTIKGLMFNCAAGSGRQVYLRICTLLAAVVMTFSFSDSAKATHAAGADLTYQCLGGLVYQIEATFYRDCGGSSEPGNVTIAYKSASCNYARTVLANKVVLNNGQEITLPCSTSPSTCNGGITTGIRKWVYRAVVTLPAACSDWVFSYRICCRNCTVTTIQNPCAVNSEIYVESTLNNLVAPGNSSPGFNNMPVAFVCLGQNFNYNQGVFDVDGDSLAYELITPKISAIAEVTWLAPATTQTPLASSTPFTLNPVTGDINFTPSALQIGILAIRVNEFRNGVLIGSTIRDMQVYTQNCFNSIPVATGINGTSNYSTNVCAGEQVCFTVSAQDVDPNQIVTFSAYNPIQGSTITQTAGNLPSLEFCWTPGMNAISRQPYIFTLTIIDNACPVNGIQTFSYSIFVNGPVANIAVTNPICGSGTGSASANVSNVPNCTYVWNTTPPQSTQTVAGLAPGNYSVTITEPGGCSSVYNAELIAPPNGIQVSCSSTGVVSCQSGNIGSAEATVSGGTAPFSYLWNTGATTSSINGLSAGNYIVTVSDANGCSAVDTTTIASAPGNITAIAVVNTPVTCFGGADGSAAANGNGGIAPYTYLWNHGSTNPVVNGLSAGNYMVTVTDANGCSSSSSLTMVQPGAPLAVNFVSTTISCTGGNNGGLNAFASGGTQPYTFNWNTGASTQNISGLTAGNYSVTVTDANGCSGNYTAAVNQPASNLSVAVSSSQQVTCFGGDNGNISLSVSGGQAPYTYTWSHGATTALVDNLEAGSYAVTVTDAYGCTANFSTDLTQPATPVIGQTTVTSNVSCNGGNNGALSLAVNGGIAPFTYLWNNGYTSQNLSGVIAGNYEVVITDGNGCTATANATISQPATSPEVNLATQQILCFNGNNGSINATATNGAGTFTYLWNTGATSSQVSALNAGTYTVTVTDGNGCTATASTVITQPAMPLFPVLTVSSPLNCASNQGTISLQVTGGTAPYTYLWSNGATSQNIATLQPGSYTVTITDANGCNAIISDSVSGSASTLSVSVNVVQPVSCFGGVNGILTAVPSGGTAPYSFQWHTGAQSATLSGLHAGNYSVTITDINGCTSIISTELSQPASGLTLSGNVTGANCMNGSAGSISLNINGGTPGYTFLWSNGSALQNLINLNSGNYSVLVTDANGCTVSETYEVAGSSELTLTTAGNPVICTGEMVTLVADSVPGSTYQWYYDGNLLNGATGMQFVTPAAGTYSVSVTNTCGTVMSNEIEVEVKSIGNVGVSNKQIICPPETAQLIATGGATYEWTPASYITFTNIPDPFVSPLTTTVYSVNITNEWGCKTSLSAEVAVICDSLLVPTGFSPNNDGVNDGYVIDGIENYPGNKLWVYNRWGKLVYKATDYNNSWDGIGNISGISNGQKVLSGTYYFILDLNDGSKPKAGYLIIRGG